MCSAHCGIWVLLGWPSIYAEGIVGQGVRKVNASAREFFPRVVQSTTLIGLVLLRAT
jgi:hypothetical protein